MQDDQYDDVEWKEPPPHDTRLDDVVRALRANPGRWARVAKDASITMFNSPWWAPLADLPDFEYERVKSGDSFIGPFDIYVRYVGE